MKSAYWRKRLSLDVVAHQSHAEFDTLHQMGNRQVIISAFLGADTQT